MEIDTVQFNPLLWLELQTTANKIAAFCGERWETRLIITLNFTNATRLTCSFFLHCYFVLSSKIQNSNCPLLKLRSHLETSRLCSRCFGRSCPSLVSWENACTVLQTTVCRVTTLLFAPRNTCHLSIALEGSTLLCLEEKDVVLFVSFD